MDRNYTQHIRLSGPEGDLVTTEISLSAEEAISLLANMLRDQQELANKMSPLEADVTVTSEDATKVFSDVNAAVAAATQSVAGETADRVVLNHVAPPVKSYGPRTQKSTYDRDEMIRDIGVGISRAEIAKKYGVSTVTVGNVRKRAIEDGLLTTRGTLPSADKQKQEEEVLTPELREEIKDLRERGMTTSEIARDLDLDPEDVALVMSRGSSEYKSPTTKTKEKTLKSRVKELYESGCGFEEICEAYPSDSISEISTIFHKLDREARGNE